MSVNYLIVALETNLRDEDAKTLSNAILMLRGVLKVTANAVDAGDWTAEMRVRQELGQKLFEIIYPKNKPAGTS